MIPRPQAAALNPLGSDFDLFLYAEVGNDRHGGALSVISALARLGVDPWEQAALLARMPVDAAVRALSSLLDRLPAAAGKPVDAIPLAVRLVTLLPRASRQPAATPASPVHTGSAMAPNLWLFAVLCLVGTLLLLLGVQRLMLSRPATEAAPVAPALTSSPLP